MATEGGGTTSYHYYSAGGSTCFAAFLHICKCLWLYITILPFMSSTYVLGLSRLPSPHPVSNGPAVATHSSLLRRGMIGCQGKQAGTLKVSKCGFNMSVALRRLW